MRVKRRISRIKSQRRALKALTKTLCLFPLVFMFLHVSKWMLVEKLGAWSYLLNWRKTNIVCSTQCMGFPFMFMYLSYVL